MRFSVWIPYALVLALAVGLAFVVISVVNGAAGWIVLGGIVVAVIGLMIAVNNRRYPTRKRTFTRDSDSRW